MNRAIRLRNLLRNRDYRWYPRYHSRIPLIVTFPGLTDVREWDVEKRPRNLILPHPLPTDNRLRVSLHRLLIETGIANSFATIASDIENQHSLLKYGNVFTRTSPELVLQNRGRMNDPYDASKLSNEIGTGITCFILREYFQLPHITDIWACLQTGTVVKSSPRTPWNKLKRPDYFCLDRDCHVVIAESKGVTSKLEEAVSKGKTQVKSVKPSNQFTFRRSCGRAVIATQFGIESTRTETTLTKIIDPPSQSSEIVSNTSDLPIRQAYAKFLRFVGQDELADILLLGIRLDELPFPTIQKNVNFPVTFLGFTPFGDILGMHSDIARLLFLRNHNLNDDLRIALSESEYSLNNFNGHGFVFSNGVVVLYNFDDSVIEELL